MRYYNAETNALCNFFSVLDGGIKGFPEKEFAAYSKKEKQYFANQFAAFMQENNALLSPPLQKKLTAYPLPFNEVCIALQAARKAKQASVEARKDEWAAFAARFGRQEQKALTQLLTEKITSDYFAIESTETETILQSGYMAAYRQIIYLENPVFSADFKTKAWLSNGEIDTLPAGYLLTFVQEGKQVSLTFSGIRLETQLFNYSCGAAWVSSPWRQISIALSALKEKDALLGPAFLNEREKSILPLCAFPPLSNWEKPKEPLSGNKRAQEAFIAFAHNAGCGQIAHLAGVYASIPEQEGSGYPKKPFFEKEKACKALQKEMQKPPAQAMARLILAEIELAAGEYPTGVELDVPLSAVQKARETVSRIFKQRGYQGEYPRFKKMCPLKGIRMLEIQGHPVLVGNQKHTACMVDCFEYGMGEKMLGISFAASTVFLKEEELHLFDSLDGRSGFFPNKFRCRARVLAQDFDVQELSEGSSRLGKVAAGAAKTAEGITWGVEKGEKVVWGVGGLKEAYGTTVVLILLSAVLGFAVLVAFFLLAFLLGLPVTLFFSGTPSFEEYAQSLLRDIPWGSLFLFTAVGIGVFFFLMLIFEKKK